MPTPDIPVPDAALDPLRAALGSQYAIERLLGQGGMGAVYLARDTTLDRLVAVKVISPDVASHAALRERFLQEARAVARLRHPNIVSVYSAGEANGVAYFVMEYVPGESLRDLLTREKRLSGERAERILREIALALHYAHAQGLVHRDVKPENILIDGESGRAMLTDFGVARAFEKDGGLTQTGMILGSPRYMAPEQASGDRAIDGRADLYGLALVGYEMYDGAPVVQASTAASMLVKHLTESPPPLESKVPGVAPHVAAAIARGLAKNPDERWQTGREFAEAISGGALTPSGELRGATTALRVPVPAKRRRVPVPLIAGVGLLAVLAGRFVTQRGAGGDDVAAYLVTPFEVQSGDQSVQWLREGSVNMLTLTLGQWSDLNVINYERTLSLLDAEGLGEKRLLSLEDALALARRARAGTVVMGQVLTTGDSLRVVARLYDARGNQLESAQQAIRLGDDPRPMFDRLAEALLRIAGGPASGVQLSAATTTSLEAYRDYLEGVKLLNSWKLVPADSAFARAISHDSTFALAYHKRSLGMGWSQVGGPLYVESATKANELAGRLPPRERSLVQGHYHLTLGLSPGIDSAGRVRELVRAIAIYDTLTRRDSLSAEAWYGLADGWFHLRGTTISADSVVRWTQRSLRDFNRTLATDSTFLLAYSHLVQLYNEAALPQNRMAFVGDSVVLFENAADPAAQPLRDAARARGIEVARGWIRADGGTLNSIVQLSQSFEAAGQRDSSLAVLRRAVADPRTANPGLRLILLQTQVLSGDTAVGGTLRYVLDRFTADSLEVIPLNARFSAGSFMASAAGVVGRSADVARAATLFTSVDSTLPFSTAPTRPYMDVTARMLRVAMGEPMDAEARRQVRAAIRAMSQAEDGIGQQIRDGSLSLPLLAFLASKDTAFLAIVKEWAPGASWTDLEALAALQRGDTAAAMRTAETFPKPDSLRNPNVRFGVGGMRSIARAELLAQLGLTRQAAETYEAIEPHRVNRAGLAEPGFAVMVRSILTRARLWRELGEREKAIAAYEEFIRRWADADGVAAQQVAEARRELAALRDAPR